MALKTGKNGSADNIEAHINREGRKYMANMG